MTDQDEVYQRAILELARDRSGAGRMEAPDGTATVDNPMCGDRVTIDLRIEDGHVSELHHHVRGCLLCEAAAGLLARHAPGADAAELRALPEKVAAFLTDAATELERMATAVEASIREVEHLRASAGIVSSVDRTSASSACSSAMNSCARDW